MDEQKKFCTNCGNEVTPTDTNCALCGAPLQPDTPAQPEAAAPQAAPLWQPAQEPTAFDAPAVPPVNTEPAPQGYAASPAYGAEQVYTPPQPGYSAPLATPAYGATPEAAPQGYAAPPAFGTEQVYAPQQPGYSAPLATPAYGAAPEASPQGYAAPPAFGTEQGYAPQQSGYSAPPTTSAYGAAPEAAPQGYTAPPAFGTEQVYAPQQPGYSTPPTAPAYGAAPEAAPQGYAAPPAYGAEQGYASPQPGYGTPPTVPPAPVYGAAPGMPPPQPYGGQPGVPPMQPATPKKKPGVMLVVLILVLAMLLGLATFLIYTITKGNSSGGSGGGAVAASSSSRSSRSSRSSTEAPLVDPVPESIANSSTTTVDDIPVDLLLGDSCPLEIDWDTFELIDEGEDGIYFNFDVTNTGDEEIFWFDFLTFRYNAETGERYEPYGWHNWDFFCNYGDIEPGDTIRAEDPYYLDYELGEGEIILIVIYSVDFYSGTAWGYDPSDYDEICVLAEALLPEMDEQAAKLVG